MKNILASELQIGQSYKLDSQKRKVKYASKIIDLDTPGRRESTTPEIYAAAYENKLLVMDGCSQTLLRKDQEVLLID